MSENITTYSQPAGGFTAISKYNPHLWSAEQLRAIFVARKTELADLQHTLRTTQLDTVGQHVLLVGARGMGKSTLMRRLALAVEDDTDLSTAWLPLRFPEEQYTVATLGQFWANVLDSLADALQHLGYSVSELDAAAERIAALPAAEQAAAYLVAIDRCADERGQRLLLLVDNTDLMLHNIGREAHWALRATLQSNPRLFWVGGSYQSLEADSDYHDAFLDFFRVITLRPLRIEEMAQALQALAETFGGEVERQKMERQLAAQPERLLTLRQLSGGNPRTTVMLYEILANGHNGSVRSDLEALLDNMTPLYKARMDSLADLPRKLFAHIAEDHSLNIAGCTPVTGNVIELAVDDSPFVVPAVEDGSNCSDELFFRVFRERLAGCFKNSRFIFGNNVLEVFNLEFSVERYAKFVFFFFKYFFEGINLFFIGRLEVKDDIAIHLHKAPVAVPCEAGVS